MDQFSGGGSKQELQKRQEHREKQKHLLDWMRVAIMLATFLMALIVAVLGADVLYPYLTGKAPLLGWLTSNERPELQSGPTPSDPIVVTLEAPLPTSALASADRELNRGANGGSSAGGANDGGSQPSDPGGLEEDVLLDTSSGNDGGSTGGGPGEVGDPDSAFAEASGDSNGDAGSGPGGGDGGDGFGDGVGGGISDAGSGPGGGDGGDGFGDSVGGGNSNAGSGDAGGSGGESDGGGSGGTTLDNFPVGIDEVTANGPWDGGNAGGPGGGDNVSGGGGFNDGGTNGGPGNVGGPDTVIEPGP